MTLTVPDDNPRFRYMRYVRPPAKTTGAQRDVQPLFPIQPNTRKMRVGIDIQTLPELTAELLRIVGRDEEVEPILMVQNDAGEPTAWLRALGSRACLP